MGEMADALMFLSRSNHVKRSILMQAVGISLGLAPPEHVDELLVGELCDRWTSGQVSACQLVSTVYLLLRDPDSAVAVAEILEGTDLID